ncbi:MAG: hypothetical protein C4290_11190 [Chloroflexota bacterium]
MPDTAMTTPGAPARVPASSVRGGHPRAALDGYWALVPVLVAVGLVALPTLAFPFGPDQAIFATIGQVINRGGYPYIDAWDQKPPGIYLLYALALRLPGPLMVRVRLFDLLWTSTALVVLFLLLHRLWNTRAAVFGTTLMGTVYFTTQGWWYLAQPDGLAALPLALALLLSLARGRWRWPCWLAAGALTEMVFQLRFTAAPLVPTFVWTYLLLERGGRQRLLGWTVWAGAGFLLVQAALLAYLAAGHALRAYLEATRFAAGYARLGWPFAPPRRTIFTYLEYVRDSLGLFTFSHAVFVLPALAGGLAACFVSRDRAARATAVSGLVAFLGIALQQKFFWYHWQVLFPMLALLSGWTWDRAFAFLEQVCNGARATAGKAALVGALLVLTPSVTRQAYDQWDGFLHRNDSVTARLAYDNQFGPYADGTYSYLADRQVADYVRAHTQPQETIYVFGYEPLIYLLSERASASRFIYSLPFMSSWAPHRWLDEFLDEIDRNRPVYFIVQRNEGAAGWITGQRRDTAAWATRLLPGVAARLERDYAYEIEIEDFTLYRRRE